MAVGVVAQASAGLGGQHRAADRTRQRDDVVGVEPPEPDALHEVVLRQAALPPGRLGRCVVPGHDHDEDLVAAQPSPDEHERPRGGVVDPLGVVDHDHHRPRGLQGAQDGQQLGAHRERVRVRRGPRGEQRPEKPARDVADELAQHPEREPGLALLPVAPQDADVGAVVEEAADQ